MSRTFHLLTGEYPPDAGGVGAYTSRLAAALQARGCAVHVWCPAHVETVGEDGVAVHTLPDVFGPASRRLLEDAFARTRGVILLQYVPNALGARGANVAFCRWLLRLRRNGADVRVMFHEPFFYFTAARPLRNALALVQRLMAAILLRASGIAYLSTERWIRSLGPFAPPRTMWVPLPIPSTLPTEAAQPDTARWRARVPDGAALVGHFGTFGDHVAGELQPLVAAVLDRNPAAHVLLIGRRSESFAARLTQRNPSITDRLHATGTLTDADAAAAISACDLLMQPYPDGVTTRRTSVMAGLALGVPTVTTTGALTERIWRESGAARLARASDVASLTGAIDTLLSDPAARAAQGRTGRDVYETRFSMQHTVDRILRDEHSRGERSGASGALRRSSGRAERQSNHEARAERSELGRVQPASAKATAARRSASREGGGAPPFKQ